jgi:hypothetical protein
MTTSKECKGKRGIFAVTVTVLLAPCSRGMGRHDGHDDDDGDDDDDDDDVEEG